MLSSSTTLWSCWIRDWISRLIECFYLWSFALKRAWIHSGANRYTEKQKYNGISKNILCIYKGKTRFCKPTLFTTNCEPNNFNLLNFNHVVIWNIIIGHSQLVVIVFHQAITMMPRTLCYCSVSRLCGGKTVLFRSMCTLNYFHIQNSVKHSLQSTDWTQEMDYNKRKAGTAKSIISTASHTYCLFL